MVARHPHHLYYHDPNPRYNGAFSDQGQTIRCGYYSRHKILRDVIARTVFRLQYLFRAETFLAKSSLIV